MYPYLFNVFKSYDNWIIKHYANNFIAGKYDSKLYAIETCEQLNKIKNEQKLVKTLTNLKDDKFFLLRKTKNPIVISEILKKKFEHKLNNKKIGYKPHTDKEYYVIINKRKKLFKNFNECWKYINEN
jgi:hypothetical protein